MSRKNRFFNFGRASGGLAMWTLVLAGAACLAWIWWEAGQGVRKSVQRATPVPAAATPPPGAIVIPVTDASGQPAAPMVLVPVNAPVAKAIAPTVPAVSNHSSVAVVSHAPLPMPVTNAPSPASASSERWLEVQVALAGRGFSCGSLDGVKGLQTRAALRAFQRAEKLPVTGEWDSATRAVLPTGPMNYTNWIVSASDLARLQPLGRTWLEKSQQSRLDYESALEMVAELSRTHPKLVQTLNPGVDWKNFLAGTAVKLPVVAAPALLRRAAFLRIALAERALQAFDAETNLLAHFPCSIAARVEKRPAGEALHIVTVAAAPNYTFDPEVFPESAEARQLGRKLVLQPGPNNPVGTVWLGLDKPGYGIHGTPGPEQVGRTESHGCFRLANWNAEHLLKLVTVGTRVVVDP